MKIFSKQYEWLRLIDVSGPFLSATALDAAFPSGLDALDKRVKRELAHYYDEWQTAHDRSSSDFPALHKAWCEAVLCTGLGFRDKYLFPGEGWSVNGEGGLGAFSPDRALKIFDDKVDLFVKFLPPDVQPNGRDTSDEWKDTFVEKMTRLCRSHGTRLGLVTNGEQWVLVNATQGGALSGSATWYARLWFQEDSTLRAFVALLGFDRFTGALDKTLPRLLDESLEHLDEVTDTLGKQVMMAVEVLLEGLDRADLDSGRALLRDVPPNVLYEASLTVMMRLVFILSAEERGLLLLGEPAYDDAYAVSTLRGKLESDRDKFGDQVLERRFDAWVRLLSLFRATYSGIDHPLLRMPAMGGSLFDPDKYPFLEGRSRDVSWDIENQPPLPIDNRTVLLLLESLQVLKAKDGAIPLSFRSLDVEQIGYVYEGLLEATGAQAGETMLGLKGDKSHQNPEIALSELEMLKMESEEKLFARMKEVTGRSAIANEYADPPDITTLPFLGKACRGDEELKNRILPFFNWLRLSEWGEPVVYHKDSFYVTEGADRRATGTHYTPKQLTEMMVKEALEPVVYIGPAEGLPRAEWKLKSPAEILNLKVCDPAMGSGAFLVQACRYLGDRLVDAWEQAESDGKVIDANGAVTDFPPDEPMSKVQEDRLVEARRLVAERCLYGVDINPLAVELAKLSLWLVTISKGCPFGFLDHNLKSGDSLLGVSDIEQLVQFRMKPEPGDPGNLMSAQIRSSVEEAKKERLELRETRIRDIRDIRVQMQHLEKAEAATSRLRDYADYFIGTVLVLGKPTKKSLAKLDTAAMQGAALLNPQTDSFAATQEKKRSLVMLSHDLPAGKTQARRPFHWALEFPEVFAQGGFNAIVGNPPFSGGRKLKAFQGEAYQIYLQWQIANNVKGSGNADLVSFFFTRSYHLLRSRSVFALLASNSIAEGATRESCLEHLALHGAQIIGTRPNMPWPGSASVVISPVTLYKPGIAPCWKGTLHKKDVKIKKGTSITLREITRPKLFESLTVLRTQLARRFSVIGEAFNFAVTVNGKTITFADREELTKAQFLWRIGDVAITLPKGHNIKEDKLIEPPKGKGIVKIRGWIATSNVPKDLSTSAGNLNSIVVMARGRLIQENILDKLNMGQMYTKYLTGQVEADVLDDTDDKDIATSDRQRLQEDDPRYVALLKTLRMVLSKIESEWSELRKKYEIAKVKSEIPAVAEWLDALPDGFKKNAEKVVAQISALPVERPEERKTLLRHGILAFERMKLTGTVDDFVQGLTNVDQLLKILADRDSLESSLYRDIIKSRLEAIKSFSGLVDADKKETVLQKYLFDHLWLLDPMWERATDSERIEQTLKKEYKEFVVGLSDEESKGRLDIRYKTSAGAHIIVELKKVRRKMSLPELQEQGQKYRSALTKCLEKVGIVNPDIQIVFVLGLPVRESENAALGGDAYVRKTLSPLGARVVYYEQMIENANKAYSEYLAQSKKMDKLDAILDQIK